METQTPAATPSAEQHPMQKSIRLVSTKDVNYDNLSYFEAAAMTMALVLAVTIGVLQGSVVA